MTDTPRNDHPGLGSGTDISAADLDPEGDVPVPATNDPDAMDDSHDLGTGDGAEPGGAG